MKNYPLCLSTAILIFLTLVSCKKSENVEREIDSKAVIETMGNDLEEFSDDHNAQNSLDYMGVYKGILPCADCEGIETIVELESGNSYVKKIIYLGKADQKIHESSGFFSWNNAGNTITIEGEAPPNQYFVGENQLIHLDMSGNRITGPLAEKYRLIKE